MKPKFFWDKGGNNHILGYFVFVIQLLSHVWLWKPKNNSIPGFSVLHCLLGFAQTHVHGVDDAIQPSHPLLSPFLSCLQSFPASGSFPMSRLFASGGQSIGAWATASILPMNIQGWFPLALIGLTSLLSKGLSRVFSSTTVWSAQPSLWSSSHIRPWPLAATAKSLQSCPTLCNPIDGSQPGSPVPGILQARTLRCPWDFPGESTRAGCHCLLRLTSENPINQFCSWPIEENFTLQ